MQKKAIVYCQHLAGIGHLVRSTELARALSADGWEVLLICGGKLPTDFPFPPSIVVEKLKAIESDPEYKSIFPCGSESSLDEIERERTMRLLELYASFQPDLLLTEMFPFGRKKFAFELLPLLKTANVAPHRPLIVCSVRDILVRRKDSETHESRVLDIVNHLYDLVLVHSDEALQPLKATFSLADAIQPAVLHTGYITTPSATAEPETKNTASATALLTLLEHEPFILVSCGSGRLQAGQQLILAALEAAPILAQAVPHKLLICAGPLVQEERFEQYQERAAGQSNVHLVHDLPFMRDLLEKASLSISLGGYNTVMELLAARAQSMILAAEPNGDTEQKTRVEALAAKGLVREILPTGLAASGFAASILEALSFPLTTRRAQMNGAEESARILTRFLEQRGAKPTNDIPHSSASQLHPTNDLAGSEAERQPMRLMVYSHDTFGLGNIRRMLSICNHLHESIDDLSILIISGSPMLQSFRVRSGIDYIKLPCLKRSESGELGVKFLPMEAEEIIRLRRELILSTVVSFKPDVVLVDKKPDGLASELEPALRHIRCALPNTLVSLVLRDILDDPEPTIETWTKHGYNNILHWYFDNVLVLGSRSIYDVCAEYKIPAALSRKFVYCGYVAREDKLQDRSKLRQALGVSEDTSLVLATAGGGEDGFNVLLQSIEAAQRLSPSLNAHTLVVTGPEMPLFKRSKLIAAAAHSLAISVVEFLPDILSYMNAADVVISMGGYNAICELATLNKRAIVVPRESPVREQSIRMERIAGYGPIVTISPLGLQVDALREAIQAQLQNCRHCDSSAWRLDMGALPRISRLIEQHVEQCASPAMVVRLPHIDAEDDLLEAAAS